MTPTLFNVFNLIVGGLRTITYGEGKSATVQTIEIRELSDLHHYVTYEVISSEPSVGYTSAIHRIRLHNVTYGLNNKNQPLSHLLFVLTLNCVCVKI